MSEYAKAKALFNFWVNFWEFPECIKCDRPLDADFQDYVEHGGQCFG